MANGRRSDAELKAISEHLFYEIQMLFGTAQVLATFVNQSAQQDLEDRVVYNALLDSFTIHVRSLLDFLYPPSNFRPDDVIANHFFDDDTVWIQQRPAKSSFIQAVDRDVNKRVAHLTYARLNVDPQASDWNYSRIADEISQVLRVFLDLAPRDRVCDSLRNFISQVVSADEVVKLLASYSSSAGVGASLSLDPVTESVLTLLLRLTPLDRSRLLNEAHQLAQGGN
ncbi:MAG: hypothetical protein L0332_07055 [Chloroflexi bacterium]|nr:hypothetical protein [Chloroflexota bacterium]MCI0647957.1 hypothetical protein [Chloroflexota bacterium]MCI0726467.1 hypothetical protein [Chloroflexota bacterium]